MSIYMTTYVIALVGVGIVMVPLGLRVLPIEKVDGYMKIIQEGAGLAAITTNLAVLVVLAAVLTLTGGGLLRMRIARSLR